MRALILLCLLAGAFGLAALWQERHLAELRAERRAAEAETDGLLAHTEQGALAPGEALLIVGRPSGAQPRARPQLEAPPAPAAAPREGPAGEAELGDFTLEVQPGQTLSGIAYLRYGTSRPRLVGALAAYNGLADPDELRAGQTLRLPAVEQLEPAASPPAQR